MHKRFYSGATAEKVDWSKTPVVEGEVLAYKEAKVRNRTTRLIIVGIKGGRRVQVWESAGLKEVFDSVQTGDRIKIAFCGETKLSGDRTLKNFDVDIDTPETAQRLFKKEGEEDEKPPF